jgi:cell shape-determining protein MreC
VDGVRKGMVVTVPTYFVGYVTEVEDHTAQVVLAIDSTVTIGAELESSKATGVVQGLWQQGGRMELRYVDRTVEPKPDELVLTTCNPDVRTANVTCGLIIGKISGLPMRDNQGDSQTVEMLPAADFDNLTLVAVILSDEAPEAEP